MFKVFMRIENGAGFELNDFLCDMFLAKVVP